MKYCCDEWKRLHDDKWGLMSLDLNTNIMQRIGAWDWEDWDKEPFKILYCMFCGAKLK